MKSADCVFVYGSLRRGGANHRLLEKARFLGVHTTPPDYCMLDLGPYPGVIQPGETAIAGEVYGISSRVLADLDALEDYPRSYTRVKIPTPWGEAWIYIYRFRQSLPVVKGGDWFAH